MSATTDRRRDLAYQKDDERRFGEFDDSEIGRWVRDQQGAQPDEPFPADQAASWQHQEEISPRPGPIAESGAGSWRSPEKDAEQPGRGAEDPLPTSPHQGDRGRDVGPVVQRETARGQRFRLVIICLVVTLLGVGSALAWRGSSAISSWAKTSVAFLHPTPTKPQPTIADLAQRIDTLTGEIGSLKQQINQLNAAQAQLNAAQAQSAKSAAEQQLKIAALQQFVDQRIQVSASKPPKLGAAPRRKPVVAVSRPRPSPKPPSRAAMPLTIVPSSTAQR